MRNLFVPRRALEATPEQVVATGAWGGAYGTDPIDGDTGYRSLSRSNREVPYWTREKAVTYSVAGYRSNPMAKAIIDTYVAFCVGDSGVGYQCSNDEVARVVGEYWDDPYNKVGQRQDLELRTALLHGEYLQQMLSGKQSGVVRQSPVDPSLVMSVAFRDGNPNVPDRVTLGQRGVETASWSVVQADDVTGLRDGEAMFWRPFRTLATDERSMPFLMPILDVLDSYDTIFSNLVDRTTLARYLVWTVKVMGDQAAVDSYVASRGGLHIPPSGSVEVHNESVEWTPQTVTVGADEDSTTLKAALTSVAAGVGLARTWLADPEDSNRATSQTMAEPVRRRVGALQTVWRHYQEERLRYVVDRAVAAGRLPILVDSKDKRTGQVEQVSPAATVTVTMPEIAAADAQLTAQVLLNLSTGLEKMIQIGALSPEASQIAARKAWEQFTGVPYRAELDSPEAAPDDVATAVDDAKAQEAARNVLLRLAR